MTVIKTGFDLDCRFCPRLATFLDDVGAEQSQYPCGHGSEDVFKQIDGLPGR